MSSSRNTPKKHTQELVLMEKCSLDQDLTLIKQVPLKGKGSPSFSASYLGLSFLFIFAPFGVIQSFVTTLLPSTGFVSLSLVYATFAMSSLAAPILISLWPFHGDTRLTMSFASCFYVLFMVSVATKLVTFVLVASALLGLAAGLLWVGQSVYLDSAAGCLRHLVALGKDETDKNGDVVGTLNARFFFFNGFAPFVGNGITLIILSLKVPVEYMVWTMSAIGCIAIIALFFADPRYREGFNPTSPPVVFVSVKVEIVKRASEIWQATQSAKGLRLLPLFLLQGSSPAWTFGIFPTLVPLAGIPPDRVPWSLALLFLIYGAVMSTWSVILGRIYRYGGWRFLMLAIVALQTVMYTLMILLGQGVFGNTESALTWSILVISVMSCAMIDASSTSMSSNCITSACKQAMPFFSLYRASAAVSFCIISIIATLIPYYAIAGVELFVGVLAVCTVFGLMKRVELDEAVRQADFLAIRQVTP
jgi:hypothetical protein